MADAWEKVFEKAREIEEAKANAPADQELFDREAAMVGLRDRMGEQVPVGNKGVWARHVVNDIVRNLESSEAREGYSVLGTLEIDRSMGGNASHLHSARFDWFYKSFYFLENRTNTAREMAARYFRSSTNKAALNSLIKAIINALSAFHAYIESTRKDLSRHNGHTFFDGQRYTNEEDFLSLRVDLVVAVGLAIPYNVGGKSKRAYDALRFAHANVGGMPVQVHQGSGPEALGVDDITVEFAWNTNGDKESQMRKCDIVGGLFTTNPIAYNSGLSARSVDVLSDTEHADWVTVIMPIHTFGKPTLAQEIRKGKQEWVNAEQFGEVARICRAHSWLSTAQHAYIRIKRGNSQWIATANNMIINDFGDGMTPTYGQTYCATLRIYGYKTQNLHADPVVPSVQCILSNDGQRPVLGRVHKTDTAWAEEIEFPLVLDSKALSCIPVLFTILAKARAMSKEGLQVRKDSKITLSSPFGLASPDDILNHIDFILSGMETLKTFFTNLSTMPAGEQDATVEAVKNNTKFTFYAGHALDGLRHGRRKADAFLAERQNAAYACAFAWSLVESATCIIWLVTYLATGLSPVAYPIRFENPPSQGVEGLESLLSLSFRQWLDFDELDMEPSGRAIVNIELRLLSQLMHGDATLCKKLIASKKMIRNSPNFRSN